MLNGNFSGERLRKEEPLNFSEFSFGHYYHTFLCKIADYEISRVKTFSNQDNNQNITTSSGEGVSSSGLSTASTLRNSQSGVNPSTFTPSSTGPHISPFSVPPPPLFSPHVFPLFQTPQYCQMPAANWGFCGGCQCWGAIIPTWFVQ